MEDPVNGHRNCFNPAAAQPAGSAS